MLLLLLLTFCWDFGARSSGDVCLVNISCFILDGVEMLSEGFMFPFNTEEEGDNSVEKLFKEETQFVLLLL